MRARARLPPVRSGLTTLRTLQSAMPACGKLVADFNSAHVAEEETLSRFFRQRVFSKNTSLHASVPLSKRLTFAKEPGAKKPGEEVKVTAAEMGRTALKVVINLVEKKSKLIQKLSLQYVDLQEPYVALVDIDMIWSMATPTAEDGRRQMAPHTSGRTTYTSCHPSSLPPWRC